MAASCNTTAAASSTSCASACASASTSVRPTKRFPPGFSSRRPTARSGFPVADRRRLAQPPHANLRASVPATRRSPPPKPRHVPLIPVDFRRRRGKDVPDAAAVGIMRVTWRPAAAGWKSSAARRDTRTIFESRLDRLPLGRGVMAAEHAPRTGTARNRGAASRSSDDSADSTWVRLASCVWRSESPRRRLGRPFRADAFRRGDDDVRRGEERGEGRRREEKQREERSRRSRRARGCDRRREETRGSSPPAPPTPRARASRASGAADARTRADEGACGQPSRRRHLRRRVRHVTPRASSDPTASSIASRFRGRWRVNDHPRRVPRAAPGGARRRGRRVARARGGRA